MEYLWTCFKTQLTDFNFIVTQDAASWLFLVQCQILEEFKLFTVKL